MEFNPFEYYARADTVVIAGSETFTVKDTGLVHHAEWTWILDMAAGQVNRIRHIQNLAGVADLVKEALTKA